MNNLRKLKLAKKKIGMPKCLKKREDNIKTSPFQSNFLAKIIHAVEDILILMC